MAYFVTGATGFIGRHLVEQLLKRDGDIHVLVREGSVDRLRELIDDDHRNHRADPHHFDRLHLRPLQTRTRRGPAPAR